MLGQAECERSDVELAAEEVGGKRVAVVEISVWSRIRAVGLEHAILAAAEIGDMAAVAALLRHDVFDGSPSCAWLRHAD